VEGPEGKPVSQRLEARIGLRLPGQVEITEGLKAGDTVVTAGHGRLLRGDRLPLRVIDLANPAAGRGPGGAGGPPGAGAMPARPAASAARTTP
jgi:membrane fusion protein (multidrug efflux system)